MADDIPEFDPGQPSTPVIPGAGTRRTGQPTREMLNPDEPKPVDEPIPEFDPNQPSTPVTPRSQRSWSDVPLEAVKNIPHSAVEFGKNIIQPFIHPIETAQNLGAIGGGALQHLGLMKGEEYKPQASAVGKFLMDRYGTVDGIKEAIATDPVGIAADVSMILTGGGSAAARLPGVAGRLGEVAATAGRLVDPLTPVIKGAQAVGTGVGRLGAELAGTSTHVGSEPFIQAAKAGYEGGQAAKDFRENITGRAPVGDAVLEAHQAVKGMGQERGAAYRAGLAQVDLDKTVLDFNKVDQALADTTTVATFKGRPLDIPGGEVQKTRQLIAQAVQEWKMLPPAEYHTPSGLNALKRQIDSIREATPWGSPERLVGDMAHHAIVNTIVDQMAAVPGGQAYAKMLRGYTEASDSLKTIARELSVPSDKSKLNIDTALRKLQSTLRDNVNSSFGRRKELADFLVANGAPNLMAKLAGQSLKPWAPRGLGKVVFNIGSMMAAFSGAGVGAAVAAGMLQSPRILGNATFRGAQAAGLVGRGTRPIRKYVPRGTSFQAGRAANIAEEGENAAEPAPTGRADGGAIRPLGREGIKARNKARAVAARERSSLARSSAQAKRKVGYAEGGTVPYPTDSPEFKEEVDRALAKNQDTIAAAQKFYPRVPINDAAWDSFIKDAPPSLNIEDRRPGYRGGLRAAHRLAGGGGINDDSSNEDPLDAELKRRNTPGGLSATAGPTVTSTTPVQDIPAPKVNAEGETLPTYVLKEMGKGLLGAPEHFTHAAGDLQRRGEYAGSQEDMPYGGPPPEEMPAGAAAALMLYGANAPFPKPGIGVFGGRGALTANKGMLAEAEKMLAAGVPHATIRNRTGWEFGSEGKPKFEISDAESRVIPEAPSERVEVPGGASRDTGFRPNKRLEEVFHHPALYEAYPWLRDMRTSLEVGEGIKPGASYMPPTKNQKRFGKAGEIEVTAPTYERGGVGDLFGKQPASDVGARDMLLHEVQHAIQEREGFAPGSSPRGLPLLNSEVETIAQNMAKRSGVDWSAASLQEKQNMIRVVRHRIYKAQSGEAEARNVQTRADSTLPSRPSWETEDVKRQNQMIAKTGRLKRSDKPFNDAKIYKLEREPEVKAEPAPGSPEWRDAPNPNAPFPQYAEQYPPVGPPVAKTFKNVNEKTGAVTYKEGFSKEQTPEAKAFMKERARIIKDMDENGYHPYFDENARFDVDPKNYPVNTDTINIVPKTLNKLAQHFYKTGAIETRRALQAAYSRGRLIGGGRGPDFVGPGGAGPEFVGPMQRLTTQDWYMMGQLEQELVRQMGPKAGREAFKEKFATSMAATTGGMKPRDNLIAGGYQNYLAAKGRRWPEETHQWPSPVGAEYGSQLSKTAQRIQDEGGFKALGEQNPKRHNFAGDFTGHRKLGTMDEQMTDLMQPGKTQPDWYGINEHVMAQEAEKAGADPRMFQETGWAGHKNAAGGPMIREVNHTIERIHRLTGMPRSEIVLRAWGKGDIPVYGAAGLAALKALEGQFTGEE